MNKWIVPSIMFLLSVLGLLTLKSVAPGLVQQQLVYVVLGFIVFAIVSRFSYSFWENLGFMGYVTVCALLIVPLIIGRFTRGTAGWIYIGDLFAIQPSQLAMPIMGVVVAQFAAHHDLTKFANLLKAGFLILLPAVLIILEPDLGTTVIFLFSMATIIFFSNVSWKQLGAAGGLALLGMIISWNFLNPIQKERIVSFVSPIKDTSDAGYNAYQALIAVGSGQAIGRGLGQGVQSHLRFLPERQTDFIFASLSEELGFVGSALIVGLYWCLIYFCLNASRQLSNPAAALYLLGCAGMLILQCTVNIGMNMGIVPITGITLPFVSYGGSSILALSGMMGLIQSIVKDQTPKSELHLS